MAILVFQSLKSLLRQCYCHMTKWNVYPERARARAGGGGGGGVAGGRLLPDMGYIALFGARGHGFLAAMVVNRVSILADFDHLGHK